MTKMKDKLAAFHAAMDYIANPPRPKVTAMTRHVEKTGIVFECDGCDRSFIDTGATEWEAALASLRQENWKAEKVAGEWLHLCPTCKGVKRK